jgi:TPR repeat protein
VASYDAASISCQALGRGVTRSKRKAMQWLRKAAESGHTHSCSRLATRMYGDHPYAREVGHVGEVEETTGDTSSVWVMCVVMIVTGLVAGVSTRLLLSSSQLFLSMKP